MKKNLSYEVLRHINLSDVLRITHPSKYISKRGKSRCPLHKDNHPSFSYITVHGIDRWNCFAGCGSGDSISFLIKTGICRTVRECISWFLSNDILTLDLIKSEDEKNYLISSIRKFKYRQEILNKFNNFTKDCILAPTEEGQKCRDYFAERGIANVETLISRFHVGFFDSSRLELYGFSKKELKQLNLLAEDNTYKLDNSICFMYEKTFGEFSGFKLRPPKDKSKSRFFSSGGKKSDDIGFFGLSCYGAKELDDIRNNNITLVEGEFDVLTAQYKAIHMYGDVFGIICRSGSSATSPIAFENLKQHNIETVAILADNDKGGEDFIEKCSRAAALNKITVDVMVPPQYSSLPGLDPADMFKDLNANEIKDILYKCRVPLSSYLANKCLVDYEKLKQITPDASSLRIKSIHKFVSIANDYSLSDLMRDEFAFKLEEIIKDPLISSDRIRNELDSKTNKGSIIRIPGRGLFSLGERGYEKWVSTGEGEGHSQKVTNFIIRYNKIVKFGHQDAYEIEGDIIVNGKKAPTPFTISSKDLVTPDNFNILIRSRFPIGIQGLHEVKPLLPELISVSNSNTPIFRGIDRLGYVAGTRTYITPSVLIDEGTFIENKDYNVAKSDSTISMFFNAIDLKLQELKQVNLPKIKDLILNKYLECLPKKITLFTLGHIFSSVLTPYFNRKLPPHALFFRGLAGSFKSTFAQISMGLFYSDPFGIKWLHARDTPYSIEMALSYVDNAPMLLDDIKSERQNSEDVMMIIQSLYDEQGRSRLNRDLTVRQGRSVANQGLIVTGEMIPTEQLSILSRMIQLEFKRDEAKTEVFTELQEKVEELRKLTPFFIKWLQTTYSSEKISLAKFTPVNCKDFERERTYHQICKMLTGLEQFLLFLVSEGGLTEVEMKYLSKEAKIYADELLDSNLSRIHAVSKEARILERISVLIKTGFFSLHGNQDGAICVGTTDSNGNVILFTDRLLLGLQRFNSLPPNLSLGDLIKDLVYQKKCTFIGPGQLLFAKELLLNDDLNLKEEIHNNDTPTPTLRAPN